MKKTAIEKTIIALTVTAFVLLLIGVGYIVGQVFILDPAFGLNFQAGLISLEMAFMIFQELSPCQLLEHSELSFPLFGLF